MKYRNMHKVDDKYLPLHRVLWVAATPHFCGHEDCEREGQYEVCLEQGESIWANLIDRDELLARLDEWSDLPPLNPEDENWEE
ncbi:MAG: hypothetical protein SFX18_17295 [Pirellulales bacterium]|nr:hypothetical protein [Pirellulales bacterium]